MKTKERCGHGCMTYTIKSDDPELDGQYDVASYVHDCPIHGWRWDGFEERRMYSLAECEAEDERRARELAAA